MARHLTLRKLDGDLDELLLLAEIIPDDTRTWAIQRQDAFRKLA